jgi:NAD(P)-dependent dehydrogenase (short-subunit alcohol dehydrogenase family)
MKLGGKVVVVTGAAGGIGRALAERFHAEGATVVVADIGSPALDDLALTLNDRRPNSSMAIAGDLGCESANAELVSHTTATFGTIDLFFANAGIAEGTDCATPESTWERAFNINVHAHRWAAKYLLPDWLNRGQGYFCSTASAAGLLSQIGSAPYTLTKHAAVAFAEWLSITYGNRGITVSCLCPQGVNTAMLNAADDFGGGANVVRAAGKVLEPHDVADVVIDAIDRETFLILPHPEVADYVRAKAADHDRWLGGMRKLQRRVFGV